MGRIGPPAGPLKSHDGAGPQRLTLPHQALCSREGPARADGTYPRAVASCSWVSRFAGPRGLAGPAPKFAGPRARAGRNRPRSSRRRELATAPNPESPLSFPRIGGAETMPARLESSRLTLSDALAGDSRSLRRRQLPTNHGHAARPSGTTRAYQGDSLSKPPRRPSAAILGNVSHTLNTRTRSPNLMQPLDAGLSIRGGVLHGEVGQPGTFQDAVHEVRGPSEQVRKLCRLGQEAARLQRLTRVTHHREPSHQRSFNQLNSVCVEHSAPKQAAPLGHVPGRSCGRPLEGR